ncbi:MAG: M20/M25/M40 family metallo-hydrolase [Planctomycetes bacterium]|nr:M20/M25/M40 family metallo-hydrolase [Planctomycetota bacterium]
MHKAHPFTAFSIGTFSIGTFSIGRALIGPLLIGGMIAAPTGPGSHARSREPASRGDSPGHRWESPPLDQAIVVRDGKTGRTLSLDAMFDELAAADVVFLGESHTDETTHRVELAAYEGLLKRRDGKVVLALEMFERDVQGALDAYLKGETDEPSFLKKARPWSNYATAYRPLIERARSESRAVLASNFPRPLIARVGAEGAAGVEKLDPESRALVPESLHPNTDAYWRRADNAMRGHAGAMRAADRLYSTQSLWDNAMGETCAKALDRFPGHGVLHVNGDFHSTYWDGTVHQLRLRKPQASIRTVSVVPVTRIATARWEGPAVADYVVFAESRASDIDDGKYTVRSGREVEYLLHMPSSPPDARVPLAIVLVDDGLSASDGMDYWKDQIGDHAAIAVIEPPHRETQEDLGVGGRWFWADSFASDIGDMVGAVEETWAYLMRHFPIDGDRVVVVGEGGGATVAVSVGLLTGRIDAAALGHAPRQFAKLKDFPLPLPEYWGDERPPRRSIEVWIQGDDAPWWDAERKAYIDVGVPTEFRTVDADPWKGGAEWLGAVRDRLGLPSPEPRSARGYWLVDDRSPRARHWARMQAMWAGARSDLDVVATTARPADASAIALTGEPQPERLARPGALPRCPGPFGGTTVLIVPPETPANVVEDWLALERDDPLAKQSRFHRLRVATSDGPLAPPSVLAKLQSENRKNILLVPATFHASPDWLRDLRRDLDAFENQMTLQWLPGLGGSKDAFAEPDGGPSDSPVRHSVKVSLEPSAHRLMVEDRIRLPSSLRAAGTPFTLHAALAIESSDPPVARDATVAAGSTATYRLAGDAADGTLTIRFAGVVDHGLSDPKEEYTRGFRETLGQIGDQGVYLDGRSTWVPTFGDRLIQFSLEAPVPPQWHLISQGKGTSRGDDGMARWESEGPMEDIYLVGGPLHRETESAGTVELGVYLRAPDPTLAQKYLDTGSRYIEMYRGLIGPYPYAKFALVENSWETGYGMPSFTLLGPQVIRFPFILHSSYPHEILHNWWGNSVFVDVSKGNWCEGLTAYLADHLVQEQRGAGAEYRRNTLQKYRDYVREGRDFPLVEFRSRHSAATEAVGYGKSLMLFHMIRREIGDEPFKKGLAAFYAKHRGARATFDDLRRAWEETHGQTLDPVVTQWVHRTGAPKLALRGIEARPSGGRFEVSGTLLQVQDGEPFRLRVPIVITGAGDPAETVVVSDGRESAWRVEVDARPSRIAVDPAFDLFRHLDPRETPPSIGQIFGDPRALAVLPSAEGASELALWNEVVEAWRSDEHAIETALDKDLVELPPDRNVWVLGRTNRFAGDVLRDLDSVRLDGDGASIRIEGERVPFAGHSTVVMRRHPGSDERAIGWITIDPREAAAGLARKLPHYGKYSYLAFEGVEPTNTVKGQHAPTGSPMVVDLPGTRDANTVRQPAPRAALAELPPAFAGKALRDHVEWLASPEREGRGLGSNGLRDASEYIARAMKEAGLEPAGDQGTFFQTFVVEQGPKGAPVECRNVVGVLRGARSEWASQSVVIGAHFDHLGLGWPDVHAGDEGKVHPGADDNASGVAILLEMARVLAEERGAPRNIVFAAFSAEECGRWGSKHYAQHPPFPLEELRAVVNVDTVGRLHEGPIQVLGTGSAEEWQHVFRGCTFVTGIPSKNIAEGAEGSDQASFLEKGIPAVQIFSGANADYHRPTDTTDKIDTAGMVRIATFLKEAVAYIAEREPPLTVRIAGHASSTGPASEGTGRRVVFGAVPAFDFQGPGVRFESLVADSPAARAGLRAGDVLVRLDQRPIADLRAFSDMLKGLEPGQSVVATIVRAGQSIEFRVVVEKR